MRRPPPTPEFMRNLRIESPPPQLTTLPLIGSIPHNLCPASLPIAFCTQAVNGPNGEMLVAIQLTTPQGVNFYMFPPDAAKQFAEFILTSARVADSGIVVPSPTTKAGE